MIQILPVSNPTELTADLWKIYEEAFPADERREWAQFIELLSNPEFTLNKIYCQEQLMGILTYWILNEFCFIEHFAISKHERNNGIGSQVLKQFLTKTAKVILEIEEPFTDIARKRIAFYERFNFKILNGDYYQPPYSSDKNRVKMLLMCYSGENEPIDFKTTKIQIYQTAYQINMNSVYF